MMRQSEFKMKYDPEMGKYTRQHMYGEGVMDVFKSFGSKLFGKTKKISNKNILLCYHNLKVNLQYHKEMKLIELINQVVDWLLNQQENRLKVDF